MTQAANNPQTAPPLLIPDGWPDRPGVRIRIDLVDPAPDQANSIEQVYAAGLAALTRNETLVVSHPMPNRD